MNFISQTGLIYYAEGKRSIITKATSGKDKDLPELIEEANLFLLEKRKYVL